MCWLTPLFGLTADNLVSAQVVTADGRRLRAAADETTICSGLCGVVAATSVS